MDLQKKELIFVRMFRLFFTLLIVFFTGLHVAYEVSIVPSIAYAFAFSTVAALSYFLFILIAIIISE